MKYVVLEVTDQFSYGSATREFPVVFPEAWVHSLVAESITRMLRKERPDGRQRQIHVVAAGFISSMAIDKGCYGESETLNVKSRGEADDRLLSMMDYTHGIVG